MSVIGDEQDTPVAEPPIRRGLSPSLRDGLALVLSNGLPRLPTWVVRIRSMLRRMVPGRYERRVRSRKDGVRLRRTRHVPRVHPIVVTTDC